MVSHYISVGYRPRTLRGAEVWGGFICHRMAHYVLIRCFLQLSLAEAPRWRNFTGTEGKMSSANR